jgi:hypothetical protein
MAMPFVAALPLRMPILPQDEDNGGVAVADMLAAWKGLDVSSSSPPSAKNANSAHSNPNDDDELFEAIDRLRKDIATSVALFNTVVRYEEETDETLLALAAESKPESESHDLLPEILEQQLHEYYHRLLECEGPHGSTGGGEGEESSPPPSSECVSLPWESSIVVAAAAATTSSDSREQQQQQQQRWLVRGQIQTAKSLASERANVMWNLAALEAHLASKENLATKIGWKKASIRLKNAASWLQRLLEWWQQEQTQQQTQQQQQQTHPMDYVDTSPAFVSFWQALLLAQAQHCVYESTCFRRPIQMHAAKLAAEAVALYGEVERIVQKSDDDDERTNKNNDNEIKIEDSHERTTPTTSLSRCSTLVPKLVVFARAWSVYMSCKAEYHQSQIHREKKACGLELARLDVAYQHAAVCKTLCDNDCDDNDNDNDESEKKAKTDFLDELRTAVDETLELVTSRRNTAERENTEQHKQLIPAQQELTKILGQKIEGWDKPLSELLHPRQTTQPPMVFQNRNNTNRTTNNTNAAASAASAPSSAKADIVHTGINHYNTNSTTSMNTLLPTNGTTSMPLPNSIAAAASSLSSPSTNILKTYVEVFKVEMTEIIDDLARATEDQTESARLALAEVHLPASLTAYKQEQSGGGLPEDLWQRVHVIQQDHKIMLLKQDLWELNDAAELARATHEKIAAQLEFDANSDDQFRKANAGFEGHNADEVQRSFRKHLTSCHNLLSSAQEGDSVLFRRLKQLDIEPKYDMLQFSKSQLDRLLPGTRGRRQDGSNNNDTNNGEDLDMVAITQHLSYLLGELKELFQERANLMALIRKEFKNFDVLGALKAKVDHTRSTDQDYLDATKHAQKAFDGIRYEIQTNMERQNELLGTILAENERFMDARMRTTTSQSADSCIFMIEDAIEEIDQLTNHVKEGKAFYNHRFLPKLDTLKHRVDDVSARMTVERLEYDEKEEKKSQERKDALMAKTLFSNESSSSASPSARTGSGVVSPLAAAPPVAAGAAAARASSPVAPLDAAASAATVMDRSRPGMAARMVGGVDDEKVAILVAMEFDADKVVAALQKHDNNVDKALNELLSC